MICFEVAPMPLRNLHRFIPIIRMQPTHRRMLRGSIRHCIARTEGEGNIYEEGCENITKAICIPNCYYSHNNRKAVQYPDKNFAFNLLKSATKYIEEATGF